MNAYCRTCQDYTQCLVLTFAGYVLACKKCGAGAQVAPTKPDTSTAEIKRPKANP